MSLMNYNCGDIPVFTGKAARHHAYNVMLDLIALPSIRPVLVAKREPTVNFPKGQSLIAEFSGDRPHQSSNQQAPAIYQDKKQDLERK